MANFRVRIETTRAGNFQIRYFNKGNVVGQNGTIRTVGKNDEMWVKDPSAFGGKKLLKGMTLSKWIAKHAMQEDYGETFDGAVIVDLPIEDLKQKFLEAMERKNLSPRTIAHYEIDIRRAIEGTKATNLADFSPERLEAYADTMRKEHLTNETIRGRMAGLRNFLLWCVEKKYLAKSPFVADDLIPKEDPSEPKYYTVAEYMALKKAAGEVSHPLLILCSLAHGSGLRKCEAVGHDDSEPGVLWEDITWLPGGRAELLLRKEIVKGGARSRSVPLNPETLSLLGSRKTGPLVTISRCQSDHYFKEARKLAGLTSGHKTFKGFDYDFDIHGLRHTFAKNCLQHGNYDLRSLQVLMGHASSKTTERYAQFEKSHFQDGTALAYQKQLQAEALTQIPAGALQVNS